jgi:nitrite reductase/ring-hydroxylating ferredoxin subunit
MAKLIRVAPMTKLHKNKPVCVERRGVPYCVVKTRENEVKSFVSICTHKDLVMFPPDLKKGKLVCPYHKAIFDAGTGKLLKSSRKKAKRLPKVDVEIVENVVYIETRKKHRKLVPKRERKLVKKEGKRLRKKS